MTNLQTNGDTSSHINTRLITEVIPETSQKPVRNQSETSQKPVRNQSETNQKPVRNQAETSQKPVRNLSETSQKPVRNQSETSQKPVRNCPGAQKPVQSLAHRGQGWLTISIPS